MRPLATRTKRVAGTGPIAKKLYNKLNERCQVNRAKRVAGTETESTSDVR